jgi:hypothetical protein
MPIRKSTRDAAKDKERAVDFATLLNEELEEIRKLRVKREWKGGDSATVRSEAQLQWDKPCSKKEHASTSEERAAPGSAAEKPTSDEIFAAAHEEELVGLAFSGGGIRSATFNLGVLQGFADRRLLPMFDYLSTVSGGGYIGSWLEAWIYRGGQDVKVAQCGETTDVSQTSSPIRRVQQCLRPDRSSKPDHSETKAIRFLREYSNYLTPRLGFLGADTWTAIAIYFRNLLLNQAILVLFLFLLLLLPYIAVWLPLAGIEATTSVARILPPVLVMLLVLVSLSAISVNMTHLTGKGPTGEFPFIARQGWVLGLVVAPLFIAAWFLSVGIWNQKLWGWTLPDWVKLGALVFGGAWTLTTLFRPKSDPAVRRWNSPRVMFTSIVASLPCGGVAGLLLWVFANGIVKRWSSTDGIWHVVSFGPPLVVLIFLLVGTLQLGLIGRLFPDPRREWWGRLAGWLLILSIVWAAAFALGIYSPLALLWATRKWISTASLVWLLNTAVAVLGGKSAKTGSADSQAWKDKILSVTPYVFILGLAIGLATILKIILAALNYWPAGDAVSTGNASEAYNYVTKHWDILWSVGNWHLPVLFVMIAAMCLLLAWRVDLNEFSMNLFYRNRLVRCYLGASHKFRNPNPFTGFDPSDDLCVSELRSDNCYSGPFPIVNTTLNLVKGQNLAWQERKGESFVVTPLRCGFDTWLERLDLEAESVRIESRGLQKYGFRPAEDYGYSKEHGYPGGLRLGTAVSISGAAASPNMGYHSAPALAFLMTFFNVRLGFWAGNPRHATTWKLPGPIFGLFRLIGELLGLTDDEARYVYLSDGGHFENLGLYELVKRRCKFIIACDADCDDAYAFGDLGNAIRKCREDIGVEITDLNTGKIAPPSKCCEEVSNGATDGEARNSFGAWHWAIGKINYSLVDPGANEGTLVYLKASMTGDEPADILNYHRQHPDFPHQSTADQWFTESQFESYRRLGQHVVKEFFEGIPAETRKNTARMFDKLREKWPSGLPQE